jgi:hypothetical protein
VLALLDTGCYMTSHNDIVLKKCGEPEERTLPPGIYTIALDGRIIFVRRVAGRFMPVSAQEQEELCQQFRL